jgi:hypothetical protein
MMSLDSYVIPITFQWEFLLSVQTRNVAEILNYTLNRVFKIIRIGTGTANLCANTNILEVGFLGEFGEDV